MVMLLLSALLSLEIVYPPEELCTLQATRTRTKGMHAEMAEMLATGEVDQVIHPTIWISQTVNWTALPCGRAPLDVEWQFCAPDGTTRTVYTSCPELVPLPPDAEPACPPSSPEDPCPSTAGTFVNQEGVWVVTLRVTNDTPKEALHSFAFAAAICPFPMFWDDFEIGDLRRWSKVVP
jgi:hypothetical protein